MAVTAATAGVVSAAPASAQTIVFCPTQNLQTAINAAAPGATIVVGGTCVGNFTVNKSLNLVGFGGATLNGNAAGTTLTVSGNTATRVQVNNLSIANGSASDGGGLFNGGATVTLNSVTVRNSTASNYGGGIASTGVLTLNNSTVRDNTAAAGGGILNNGTMTTNRSTLRTNTASQGAGGLLNAGISRLNYSAVTGNISNGGANTGGGIYNLFGSVFLLATNVSGNTPNNCTPAIAGCTG
ncbi:hypothetical protein [Streptomyces sp. NPDC005408]|uniref:hypothetical protein n=1 Tax=Streptomyces sp. NPDC005408 TaxID=3155341 RepID=UPI0033B92D0F